MSSSDLPVRNTSSDVQTSVRLSEIFSQIFGRLSVRPKVFFGQSNECSRIHAKCSDFRTAAGKCKQNCGTIGQTSENSSFFFIRPYPLTPLHTMPSKERTNDAKSHEFQARKRTLEKCIQSSSIISPEYSLSDKRCIILNSFFISINYNKQNGVHGVLVYK